MWNLGRRLWRRIVRQYRLDGWVGGPEDIGWWPQAQERRLYWHRSYTVTHGR